MVISLTSHKPLRRWNLGGPESRLPPEHPTGVLGELAGVAPLPFETPLRPPQPPSGVRRQRHLKTEATWASLPPSSLPASPYTSSTSFGRLAARSGPHQPRSVVPIPAHVPCLFSTGNGELGYPTVRSRPRGPGSATFASAGAISVVACLVLASGQCRLEVLV
jgi:hypothetical protein